MVRLPKMYETLIQTKPIYWKGTLCKLIKWDTLNFGGKLKIKLVNQNSRGFLDVDISELYN